MGKILANLYLNYGFILGGMFATAQDIFDAIAIMLPIDPFSVETIEKAIQTCRDYPAIPTYGIWSEEYPEYRLDIKVQGD